MERLERVTVLFRKAEQMAAGEASLDALVAMLEQNERELRSIGYEGAAFGLALRDLEGGGGLALWNGLRVRAGMRQAIFVHSGLGWALARLERPAADVVQAIEPVLRWSVLDGVGYYDGLFRRRQTIGNKRRSQQLAGYAARAYDQGIGRSLWYAHRADPAELCAAIEAFGLERSPHLWRGVGVACSFLGEEQGDRLIELHAAAGGFASQMAVGATLAARARILADNPDSVTERACRLLCGRGAEEAGRLAEACLPAGVEPDALFIAWFTAIARRLGCATA